LRERVDSERSWKEVVINMIDVCRWASLVNISVIEESTTRTPRESGDGLLIPAFHATSKDCGIRFVKTAFWAASDL